MPDPNSAELSRQILALAPDAVLFADRKGVIRLWNRGAELIFGFSAAEALGQSLDLIIPERLRAVHWQGYFRVMRPGKPATARTCSRSPPFTATAISCRASSPSSCSKTQRERRSASHRSGAM